ncbi:MAG: sulfur carrier protein ThiS [Desulfobacula sp.]|nr:sulfur carrier protein ThiS [Desulfobacula sp.]
MNIKLNGNNIESNSLFLMDLVLEKGFDPASLVAEVNQEVIRQEAWKSLSLKDGDSIELLSFVGGG